MKRLRRVAAFVGALLRELGDETAYRRHLEHCGAPDSAQEWRRFSEERFRARFTRPKCC
jgi:hypothetical protein